MEILNNKEHPFPRLCAHRGVHRGICPENSMPAFGLALALGADEIELDLWPSKDNQLVVFHDATVKSITGANTLISDLTMKEIKALDIGTPFSPAFKGLQIPTFDEVLDLVGKKVILNIHIKSPVQSRIKTEKLLARQADWRRWYYSTDALMPPLPEGIEDVDPVLEAHQPPPYNEKHFQLLLNALDSYHCRDYAYIAGERDVLTTAREMAPDMDRCCLEAMNFTIVEHAIAFGCKRLQFNKGLTTKAMLDKAHDHGIMCNMFWCNIGEEARAYFDAGIDCILTDNLQLIKAGL